MPTQKIISRNAVSYVRDFTGCRCEARGEEGGKITVRIEGRMDAECAAPVIKDLLPGLRASAPSLLVVDLGEVSYLDDFGALVLAEMGRMTARLNGRMEVVRESEHVREMLAILRLDDFSGTEYRRKRPTQIHPGLFVRVGEAAFKISKDFRYLISFIGSVFLALLHAVRHPRSIRWDDVLLYMQKTGVDALPIVGLISFLLGLIMAFMSSVQLRQFGANIYVASLVSLAMVRELGPIMTAIIVAGRSGSAFAAEIGTMRVSEEVDALYTMGFDPTRFLVVPKLIAAVIVLPFLTLFSDLFAIFGGFVVGVTLLDLTFNAYVEQTLWVLTLSDLLWGFVKSSVFAVLIVWIGCFRGFQVRGGAAAVGEATTSSVVSSLFLIILTDSVFAVILQYWG
jgi:phospholipid/cholesterol/gamma-HCH transport system permease protein